MPSNRSLPPAASSPAAPSWQLGSGRVDNSARFEAYSRLRSAILDVELLPGAPLSENALAERMAVSRTPVREALQRLANEGLVQVRPQIGTFVARLNLGRIREALFMREAVECQAIERIETPLGKAAVARLNACVASHLEAAEAGDVNAVLAHDEEFHQLLLSLAGLPGVWRYVLAAREMHRRVRVVSQLGTGSAQKSVSQHRQIIRKLAAGDAPGAAAILREHIRMNLALAEELQQAHPAYFDAPSPDPL